MRQLFPVETGEVGAVVEVTALLDEVRSAPALAVGDERVVDFLGRFARALLAPAVARAYPELASLGFFLRRGGIRRALARLADDELRLPRGLVFHVPPANVDTIFVYSWALSALAGNRNIVRLSPRAAGAADAVLDAMRAALPGVPGVPGDPVRASQRIVTYDRDDAVTAALSAAADLRVLWGGDASVRALRRFELAPHARDLTFPDRSSFAIISADGWARASQAERRAAVEGFRNDVFWFDQAACASPRGVYWVGGSHAGEFRAMLAEVAADPEPAMAVQNRVGAYGAAADGRAARIAFDSPALTTLEAPDVIRDWLGAGVLTQSSVSTLDELVPKVVRRDQTITHFGFSRAELIAFARQLSGVDRLVPFGSALKFAPVWDGYHLLAEFTRIVTVTV
ncbi:acyl-CoA reductase [Amycolatopsis viridis]|uniref:Long-chain-fatty-acyl-CoA reductase n=1 Tax=Amycolatopsis viridis TaxID=185678 RepID=A0ABX0T1J0_9PSEU|nr:acyl-CoA reductase [Amycolatopsis viridis]NIH83082.1 hypothetical protein [Amycolatopsis viridis]